VNRLLEAIPYARLLGVEIEPAQGDPGSEQGFDCVLPFREEIVGNARLPAVHGGVIGAFLELTALLRLMDADGIATVPKPINFSIDYLRSAGPRPTRARAEIFKLGRRIAHVHVVAWQEQRERPVAAGNGKFLLA
jgi:uncharacterized protein (TIGR00369 family)